MDSAARGQSDSLRSEGGSIPGSGGIAAFRLRAPEPSALPILIAVPHAGRAYPPSLLEAMRNPGMAAIKLEDRHVDRLADAVAQASGAALLVAQAPRAMIDLNRAEDEVDWDMLAHGHGEFPRGAALGLRARSGLGLVPRRLPGLGELWKRMLHESELAERLDGIHRPYHQCLAATLAQLRERWGAALLIDLHSMPPLGLRGAQPAPEFVLGDRFGASCSGALVASSFAYFGEQRRRAAHNRPYAGGHVLERHADPDRAIHAIQLEIDRSSYLDSRLSEPGAGFAAMVQVLTGLVQRLAGEVAELGQQNRPEHWAAAAE
jgi:N-formylglutamate amidohydrolase